MAARKVIILAGAPRASTVRDSSSACTVDRFDDAFVTLLHLPRAAASPDDDEDDLWTQFCEESLAQHTSLSPSQLGDSLASLDSDNDDDSSLLSTTLSSSRLDASTVSEPPPPPVPLHLSDLEDVPPARRILALQPQTVTLNLIVGVISVAQPRPVTTRWGQALALVEVLVGDDTAAGFAITFWLPAAQADSSIVAALRRQDVVLLENVALHVFRGKVYGQSLRKGLTRISLLWRHDGTGYYSTRHLNRTHPHPQQQKARLVKNWVLHFVGRDPSDTGTKRLHSWDIPPDDTQ
ncbi:hypothetical protein HIM_01857 [Hirsutella minnesotensis 3608]|nr:hypothetical protein HIM_01857 [Hirsutella minnesotensis 3608]